MTNADPAGDHHPARDRRSGGPTDPATGPGERPPAGLAVLLRVAGRRVLVVGAGRVAARKVDQLLAEGAVVHVVAPEVGPGLRALVDDGRVTLATRAFETGDLDGAWLVVTATGRPEVDGAVFAAAEARGVPVNAADDPEHCSVTLMAVVRRGDLRVGVATGGASPGLAAWLRRRLEDDLGPELAVVCDLLAARRARLHAAGRSTEDLAWAAALDAGLVDLVREGRLADAEQLLDAYL
jgi:precorrin-2 dehydrogenase / sirohydrochlorin ferrochelatase